MIDVFNYVCKAVTTGYQEEADGEVRSCEMRRSASYRTVASLLALRRRCEHMEPRDTYSDQAVRGMLFSYPSSSLIKRSIYTTLKYIIE